MSFFARHGYGRALLLAAAVMMLMSVFMVVGSFADDLDSRLNGTWVTMVGKVENEFRFENGRWMASVRSPIFSGGRIRGTYTTNNGTLFTTITKVNGAFVEATFNSGMRLDGPNRVMLEGRWYSAAELIVAMKSEGLRLGRSQEEMDEMVTGMVKTFTTPIEGSYVVDETALVMTTKQDGTRIYTRK